MIMTCIPFFACSHIQGQQIPVCETQILAQNFECDLYFMICGGVTIF